VRSLQEDTGDVGGRRRWGRNAWAWTAVAIAALLTIFILVKDGLRKGNSGLRLPAQNSRSLY
jgi:hypothetical protein